MRISEPENYKGLTFAREAVIVILLYALVVCVIYAPVVFSGKSLLPPLYQPHGVVPEGVYGREGRLPVNTFNVDLATPAYYEFPINKLVGDIYKSLHLPLWNPYQAGGTPLSAQYSTRAFFPYQIIEDISPVGWWDFFLLGRLLLAGFFTYLFLRHAGKNGFGLLPSFAGGLFYMFSGVFTWFINLEQLTNTAMILPLVMYGVDALAKSGGSLRSQSRAVAFCSVCFALLLLAGQPEVALYATLLAFLYFIYAEFSFSGASGSLRRFLGFPAAYALGLGLSAFLIIPFIEFVGLSFHIHPLGGRIGTQSLVNWRAIFAIVTPGATEFPAEPEMALGAKLMAQGVDGGWFRFMPINGVWDTLGGYTGILPVVLVFYGFLTAFFNRNFAYRGFIFFFTAFALFVVLKNLGVQPFVSLGSLWLFDQVWSLRWAGPAWVFCAAIGAAAGLEAVIFKATLPPAKPAPGGAKGGTYSELQSVFARSPLYSAFVPFALLMGAYLVLAFLPAMMLSLNGAESFSPNMRPFAVPALLASSVVTVIIGVCAFLLLARAGGQRRGVICALICLAAVELWWAVPRGWQADWLSYKWAPFFTGIAAAFLFYKEFYRAAVLFCGLFLALFFLIDFYSPAGLPVRQDPFKKAPFVEFLRAKPGEFRVAGAGGALYPNFAGAAGLKDVRYVNALLPETFHRFRKERLHVDKVDESTDSVLWFTGRPERSKAVYSGGGVKYVPVTRPVADDISANLANYSLLGVKYFIMPAAPLSSTEALSFKENYGLGEHGFKLVYDGEVRIFENPAALKRAFVAYETERAVSFVEAQEKAAQNVLSLGHKAVVEDPAAIFSGKGDYNAAFKRYEPNMVELAVESDRAGLLVLTDVYYPGWRAFVNGEDVKIFRVNGLVRGVAVGKGKSAVVFSYLPPSFKIGLISSLSSAAICLFLFFGFKEKQRVSL